MGDDTFARSTMHKGTDILEEVVSQAQELAKLFAPMFENIEAYKNCRLDPDQQRHFAKTAVEYRFDRGVSVLPEDLLRVRRAEDKTEGNGTRDLWKTFNVVQENLIRGGIETVNTNQRRRRSRPIRSIDSDMRINKKLWNLTESIFKNLN